MRDREKAAAEFRARGASTTTTAPDLLTGDDTASITSTAIDSHEGTSPKGSAKPPGSVMDALGEKKSKSLFDRLKRASTSKPAGQSGGGLAETLAELSKSPTIRRPGLGSQSSAGGGGVVGGGGSGSGVTSTPRVSRPLSGSLDCTAAANGRQPTDMSQIRSTVQKAIDASRPEVGTQISDSRQAVADVSESQNGYCDLSAEADLALGECGWSHAEAAGADRLAITGDAERLSIWIPTGENCSTISGLDTDKTGTPNAHKYVMDKNAIFDRFSSDVLIPIAEVFKVGVVGGSVSRRVLTPAVVAHGAEHVLG